MNQSYMIGIFLMVVILKLDLLFANDRLGFILVVVLFISFPFRYKKKVSNMRMLRTDAQILCGVSPPHTHTNAEEMSRKLFLSNLYKVKFGLLKSFPYLCTVFRIECMLMQTL